MELFRLHEGQLRRLCEAFVLKEWEVPEKVVKNSLSEYRRRLMRKRYLK